MGLITVGQKDLQAKATPKTVAVKEAVRQRTLKQAVSLTGIGLHSGAPVTLTLHPAPAGHGIHFHRIDMSQNGTIAARWDCVSDTRMCSALSNDQGVSVGTVEHLMAALAGCGIDNVRIELDGPEVPVMDGSSQHFVDIIRAAGVVALDADRRVIRVLKPVSVETDHGRAELTPSPVFSVDFEIEFKSQAIRRQHLRLGVVNGAFCQDLRLHARGRSHAEGRSGPWRFPRQRHRDRRRQNSE